MKKYAVGDVVMIPVTIIEVHPQGFRYGLHANGAPNVPPHANPTEEQLADARKEQPATVIGELSGDFAIDASKRVHFSADADL